jgi:membrane-bound lytic murein transglycosylase D
MRAAAREFCAVLIALAAAPGAVAAPRSAITAESAAERRAVRGVPIDDSALSESPELREVRRFEEENFPRDGAAPEALPESEPVAPAADLPGALEGRWGGSGDIPAELRSAAATRRPAPAPPAQWLENLALPDLPVRWEPQVVRFLQFWKTDPRGRTIMASWLRKLGRYRALFESALEREGVPRDIVFVSMIESGFEPGAVSRVGAGGLWQFMPGVARAYGLEVGPWVDARRDPERSVEAAARYLKDLYVRFGSWPLALAGYHAGYGGVLKSIVRYNTNDYWELCRHEAGLPWETTLYVPKILAAAIVAHNLQAFGYDGVTPDAPWAYDRTTVPGGTTLATVARAAGTRTELIESLNPELVRGRTPVDRGSVAVRLPAGAASAFALGIDGARAGVDEVETVVLRFGESLEDVARTRGLALRELKKLNGVRELGELRPGATVVVPRRGGRGAVAGEPDDVLVAVPDRTFTYADRDRVFYRTREGDTLREIAGVFHVAVDELVEWNNIDPEAKLHPKLVLQLYVRKDFDRAGVALLDPVKVHAVTLGTEEFLALEAARRGKTRLPYVARSGDTLAKIARRYGLQPGDLARINRLSSSSELQAGQTIYVYSPTPQMPREGMVGRAPRRRVAIPVAAASRDGSGRLPGKSTGSSAAARSPASKATPGKSGVRPTKTPLLVKTTEVRRGVPVTAAGARRGGPTVGGRPAVR